MFIENEIVNFINNISVIREKKKQKINKYFFDIIYLTIYIRTFNSNQAVCGMAVCIGEQLYRNIKDLTPFKLF